MDDKNIGSSFDDFLKEDGIYDEVSKMAEEKVKNNNLYFCNDCNCFVEKNHRCQQWETVSIIPKAAIEKLKCCGNCADTQKCSMNNGRGVCKKWNL